MVNLLQLNLESATYTDENEDKKKYIIVPVVTLTQAEIDKFAKNEKRLEGRWKKFYKFVTKNFKIASDVKLSDDENEPLKDYDGDGQYVFTDLTSLTALDFNERDKYDIGFRYVEDDDSRYQEGDYVAHMFSDDFIKTMNLKDDVETVVSNIPFSHIQSSYEEVLEALNRESRQNEKSLHEQYRINKSKNFEENTGELEDVDDEDEQPEVDEPESNQATESESSESTEPPVETENTSSEQNVVQPVDEPVQDDYIDDYVDEGQANTLQSDLSELRNELYNVIDNLVPNIYLQDIDIDLQNKYNDSHNSAYVELENNVLENVKTIKKRELERLNDERQTIVDRLYRKASSLLYKKFTDIEKLYLYESEESEYHNEYMNIYNKKEQVLDSAEQQRVEKFAELTRRFEEDMERRARQAYEEEKSRIEREERHKVEDEANAFKDDIIANAEELFGSQINNLMSDIDISFESRKYGVVDNVLDSYQSDIDNDVTNFKQQLEDATEKVVNKHNESIKTLNEQIQDIEKDHIQNNTQFDEKVKLKVQERTQALAEENKDIKSEHERMLEELERLRESEKRNQATIDNLQLENQKKEERISVTEADAQFYRSRFEEHQQRQSVLGHNNNFNGNNGNFSNVVAPNSTNGEGNLIESVSTEKVDSKSLMDKLKSPLVSTMLAVSVISVGLFGASSFEHSQEAKADEQVSNTVSNINEFKKTNNPEYLSQGTTLTIRADNRLKPSKVKSVDSEKVLVESEDGKEYKLKKQ